MDMGYLIAKKQLMRIWCITPIVGILMIGAASNTFRTYKGSVLSEQEKLYQIIPQMEITVLNAENLINEFSTTKTEDSESSDNFLALFNQVAESEQFKITSAGVKSKQPKKDQPIIELEASVQGEGSLIAVIKFLDSVLSENRLLSEKEIELLLLPTQQGRYDAKFVFTQIALQKGDN